MVEETMRSKILTSTLIVLLFLPLSLAPAVEGEGVDLTVTILGYPVADAGGPYFGRRGESLSFDGTWSYDPDGEIVSYSWDFGDGETGVGPTPSHVYQSVGKYTVTLTVTDNDELTDGDVTTVYVSRHLKRPPKNKKPKAEAGPNVKISVGGIVYFSGAGSSDKDGEIVSYMWRFGDGETAMGLEVSHYYLVPDRYIVTLTVKDDMGAEDSDKCHVDFRVRRMRVPR